MKYSRMNLGKKIAIIVGSVMGGVLLIGLIVGLILFRCRNKKGRTRFFMFQTNLFWIYFSFVKVSSIIDIDM